MKLNELSNIISERMIPQRVKHLLELERKEIEGAVLKQKFRVENFILPVVPEHEEAAAGMEVSSGMGGNIKVRIIQLDYQYFNSIDTICQNLQQDKRVDLLLLVDSGVDKRNTELLLGKGYKCCEISQYAIASDTPDIVIETMTYRNLSYDLSYKKIKKYAGTFILIPLEIVNYYEREYGIIYWKRALGKIRPDVTILDKSLYEFLNKKIRGYKFVKMGHAKYDTIYEKLNGDVDLPKDWAKKLEGGGKTVLWTTVHGIARDHVAGNVTFHEYAPAIFEWFGRHKECTLIFRPSSGFFTELVHTTGFWSMNDLRQFRTMFSKSSNMILDETSDYATAFTVSDAIMTEANGILISYLATKKPIMYLKQELDRVGFQDKKLIKNYYIGDCSSNVIKYLDMVYEEKDPLYERRMKTLEEYIPIFDGNNGKRIKDYIMNQYFDWNTETS